MPATTSTQGGLAQRVKDEFPGLTAALRSSGQKIGVRNIKERPDSCEILMNDNPIGTASYDRTTGIKSYQGLMPGIRPIQIGGGIDASYTLDPSIEDVPLRLSVASKERTALIGAFGGTNIPFP